MISNETALKPCPFCGGEAEWNLGKKGDDTPWRYIACSECESMGPHVEDWQLSKTADDNDAVLIEAWNTRIARTPADGQEPVAGWKLVPANPTMAMLNAAIDTDSFKLGDISPLGFRMSPQTMFERCWTAMLAAAPAHPVPADGPADAVSEAEVEAALDTWPKPWEEYNLRKAIRAALEAAQRARK